MGKEILTFEDIEIEKNKFYGLTTSIILGDVDIEKVLTRFILVKTTISTLLVACIRVIKLNHYI